MNPRDFLKARAEETEQKLEAEYEALDEETKAEMKKGMAGQQKMGGNSYNAAGDPQH